MCVYMYICIAYVWFVFYEQDVCKYKYMNSYFQLGLFIFPPFFICSLGHITFKLVSHNHGCLCIQLPYRAVHLNQGQ